MLHRLRIGPASFALDNSSSARMMWIFTTCLILRVCVCQAPGALTCVSPPGSILGPFWVHSGSILGPFWVHSGSILGPFWVHSGSILGPFWGPFWGPFFGSNWGMFVSMLCPFGVHLGSMNVDAS